MGRRVLLSESARREGMLQAHILAVTQDGDDGEFNLDIKNSGFSGFFLAFELLPKLTRVLHSYWPDD